jgi:catechol 2,3-dioxygenase-like lactoylglutathione lyase family enzyme
VSERPPVWIGHAVITVSDVDCAADFYVTIGMREIGRNEQVAIIELRGGTHLVLPLAPVTPGDVPFDLMVEDLNETHRAWTEQGLAPSAISSDRIHDSFVVTDPDGHALTISSSHVVGPV